MLMQIYTHVFSARVDDEEDLPTTFLSQKEILSQLQNIFPNQPFEELKNASLSSSDINEAVDNLLNPLTSVQFNRAHQVLFKCLQILVTNPLIAF